MINNIPIIQKHPGRVLMLNTMEDRKRLDQFNKYTNKYLNLIAKEKNIKKHITTYSARHSWATVASSLGISKDVISAALGHSGNITDTYIDFDVTMVDNANRAVIDAVINHTDRQNPVN